MPCALPLRRGPADTLHLACSSRLGPQYWSSSVSSNRAFFTDLVNAAKANGVPLGVYTSESQVRRCKFYFNF